MASPLTGCKVAVIKESWMDNDAKELLVDTWTDQILALPPEFQLRVKAVGWLVEPVPGSASVGRGGG